MLLSKLISMFAILPLPTSPHRQLKSKRWRRSWTGVVHRSVAPSFAQLEYPPIRPPEAEPDDGSNTESRDRHRQPVLAHPGDVFRIFPMPRTPAIVQIEEGGFVQIVLVGRQDPDSPIPVHAFPQMELHVGLPNDG